MWTTRQAAALSSVFESLNQSGMSWLVLRNYEGLPEGNRSKDIDLGFSKTDLPRAREIAGRALAEHGFHHVCTVDFQYACCSTYFCISDGDVVSIKIDLLDGFVWRGAQVVEFSQLYQGGAPYKNFFVPNAVDDALMLWMKPLMTGGFVKKKYTPDIRRISASHSAQFRQKLYDKFGPRMGAAVWPLLESGRFDETVPYQRRLCRAAWLRAAKSEFVKTVVAGVAHFYYELARRSRREPASILAVVGPDGVGKTTFIELLQKELGRVLVKDDECVIVEHFRPNVLPNLKKLIAGKTYDMSREKFTNPHRAPAAGRAGSLVRLVYYWSDYLIGYWLRVRRKCAHGNVVIFDRYFYDFIVDPRRSRIDLPAWLRKAFRWVTPEPDLVFFLDCDAETVFARKQELTLEEIERQLGEYRKLSAAFPKRFVRLDSHQPPEMSCRQALTQIVERSFRRVDVGPRR